MTSQSSAGFDSGHPPPSERPEVGAHRLLLVVAAIGLFGPATITWTSIIQLPLAGALAAAAFALAIAVVAIAVTCRLATTLDRLDWVVLVAAVVLMGAWAAAELYFEPAYGTDEAAFVQYAAKLVMHGHNPYQTNLLPALTEFRVPASYATYKLDGTIASNLAYPSLSFLLIVPAVLLTHGVQAVIVENVFFLVVELILVSCFLPRRYRSLGVVIVLGLPFLFTNTLGGGIVTMAIPFMIVVARKWSDVGRGGRLGRAGVLQAVCLGLAASISQFPWFVAPFLVLGLWRFRSRELGFHRGTLVVTRFFLTACGTALLINAPFIVWAPRDWITGILSPLFQHAIPFGQGLIDATVYFHLGGGNLSYYTYAAIASLIALLIAYGIHIERLWKLAFIVPSAVFLLATRSLYEYLIMMVAMWIVSVVAAGDGGGPRDQAHPARSAGLLDLPLVRSVALGIPMVVGATCIVLALTTAPPLSISIKAIETNGQFGRVWQIRTLVTNRSRTSIVPHFATDGSGYLTTFWNTVAGPRTLRPGERALYTLVAPNVGSMPGVTQSFVLQAVTESPDTISSSARFTPEGFETYISPSYVNARVPLGKSVTLSVELRSVYGAPVHRQGVRIALGEVIYAQSALIPAEAQINGSPPGQSPVTVMTDGDGVATFQVRNTFVQGGNPVYFQAYADPISSFPYGYSEVVSVQWATQR